MYTGFKWLRPNLVLSFPFLSYDPGLTPGGSRVLVDLVKIDEQNSEGSVTFLLQRHQG